jgi:hypothetical protein
MRALIEAKLKTYGRFQQLEEHTAIKVSVWKSWWADRQRPTAQMIEAVACLWPEHAYWLATGDELPREGLVDPTKEQAPETSAITAITSQVLSIRMAIRNDLMASRAANALSHNEQPDEANIRAFVDKWIDRFDELEAEAEIQTVDIKEELSAEGWNKRLQDLMKRNDQLNELEKARERLILQVLKGE